jgi:hypothetical protein
MGRLELRAEVGAKVQTTEVALGGVGACMEAGVKAGWARR